MTSEARNEGSPQTPGSAWIRGYDDFWFDGAWKTSTADADDDKPSHWMPLPLPPNKALF